MKKRAFWLLLALLATQSMGCWWWCHRPFLFRRWCSPCCSTVSHDCCASPGTVDYGPMPPAPTGPTMPPATPLTRR